MEAELKAAAAREAAEAAARQEAMAARLEFSATQAHEEVMDVMALQVVVPDASNQTTRARRSLFPGDTLEVEVQPPRKMTPRKKQLGTKMRKTPQKKRGSKKN
ncbi:uncharacterized protein LOC120695871 [Panicum virgatum]|uniref:uncharacterized protein LOC120695871 n=1 Tax=Panicum virgatum TaxID=38727 RepID=UPI0019D5C618|nr:uncharacterized protein LOC120695871 [Panicum virgatum]